ncbi:MAG: hypothetical protein OEX05_05410, partial [Chloroflexota bacterium]|nr:hypothetical protein [Chloroflexota bacterium]
FLRAREARDIDAALAYLDRAVNLDWGPGRTYQTLEAGLAWEDAFGVVFTFRECHAIEAPGPATVQCQILAQTSVAESLGHEPGIDCIDFTLVNGSITQAVGGTHGPDCGYDYWEPTFVPFYAWMRTAHPESDPDAMYDDRISPEGQALWAKYTQEFLAGLAS